jgi:RNase P subunit RPR2
MRKTMDRICQHCGALIVGNAYRVTSEEEGISLLDMIVCSRCFVEAKRLHLHAEAINVRSKEASATRPTDDGSREGRHKEPDPPRNL